MKLPVCQVSARALHETGHFLSFLMSIVKKTKTKEEFLKYAQEAKEISISLIEEIGNNEVGGVVTFDLNSLAYKDDTIRLSTMMGGCVSVYTYFMPEWEIVETEFEDFVYKTGGKQDWDLCKKEDLHTKFTKSLEIQEWFRMGLFRKLHDNLSQELCKKGILNSDELLRFSRKHYHDLKFMSKRA